MSGERASCAGRWGLFDSTEPDDHQAAAAICADCPVIAQCRELLRASYNATSRHSGGPVGTWAGRLLGEGAAQRARRTANPREHGTDRGYYQHRYRQEWACEACREAHRMIERQRVEKAQVRGGFRTPVRVESETKSGAESAQRIRPLATVSTTAKGA